MQKGHFRREKSRLLLDCERARAGGVSLSYIRRFRVVPYYSSTNGRIISIRLKEKSGINHGSNLYLYELSPAAEEYVLQEFCPEFKKIKVFKGLGD